jgi:chemotaxis protein MotB
MQAENKWVVAGDMLFPEGGYQLGAAGQHSLGQYVPRLQNLQNAKVVVYGYTDNLPVGPPLQRAGIKDKIDLSSRRADNVVAYFRAQGVNPNIISAKGFGDTHPVASNDTLDDRAKKPPHRDRDGGPGCLTFFPHTTMEIRRSGVTSSSTAAFSDDRKGLTR